MNDSITTVALLLGIAGFVLGSWALYSQKRLRQRFKAAFGNLDSSQNLADTVVEYFQKVGASEKTLSSLRKSYKHLSVIGTKSLQKVGIIRFNPFRNTGGDQSFVLALLDNHDTGFLLTSIHGREGTRIYIKAIEYGSSKQPLSAEETAALANAKKGNAKTEES